MGETMWEDQEVQELRIALVMNGGVSLAVWMGGVTLELDRVRRGDGVYAQLLELTKTEARIDVIAGASAGGINGAVLALAIARNSRAEDIRELWMTKGDITGLLRDPLQRDAPSVLQGDGKLLGPLNGALASIAERGCPDPPGETRPPLHLSITGTILRGELTTYPDRFGAMIPDVTNRALFRFRRPGVPQGDPWPDDFARGDEPGPDLPVARLALAARSSASFPGAFEPSLVPVGGAGDALHPDMGAIADFGSTRWVIDGGVLVNTPVGQALDAIRALPAERPVRRVLGYVVPNPAAHDHAADGMPSASDVVLDALSRLPRVQSVGRELAEIEENNRKVRRRREARANTLTELDPETLPTTAGRLFRAYLQTRAAAAQDDIVRALVEGSGSSPYPTAEQLAGLRRELGELDVPWLPLVDQPGDFDKVSIDPWGWGFAPVENAANVALEMLHEMVAPEGLGRPIPSGDLEPLRERTHIALQALREIEDASTSHWQSSAPGLFELQNTTAQAMVDGWKVFQAPLLGVAVQLAEVVTDLGTVVLSNLESYEGSRVWRMLAALDRRSAPATLRRLLALDVVQRSSGAELAGIEQEVELVLMSANAANAFGRPTDAARKLAGLQVGHFGAFYKSSWRANDWMWGRLDGADRLVRTLLDPRRVQTRVRSEGVAATVEEIHDMACASDTPGVADWLVRQWSSRLATSIEEELWALAKASDDPPLTALESSYEAIRLRLQVEVVVEEIPKVAAAVVADRTAAAAPDSAGSVWQEAISDWGSLTVEQAVAAFKGCRIGEEMITQEIGSDRFTKVSTTSAAVVGSVLGGALPRFKVLKPALAIIRGLLLTLYLLGRGVTGPSKTGRFLVALTLALGGSLVAVYAVGTRVPGLLLLLGSTILVAGVLLAVLRKTWAQIAVAVGLLLGSAAAFYGIRVWHGRPAWVDPLAATLAVVLMAFGATALGWTGKKDSRR
jgi:patatin-related protein